MQFAQGAATTAAQGAATIAQGAEVDAQGAKNGPGPGATEEVMDGWSHKKTLSKLDIRQFFKNTSRVTRV